MLDQPVLDCRWRDGDMPVIQWELRPPPIQPQADSLAEVARLYHEGDTLAQQGEFQAALATFEKGLELCRGHRGYQAAHRWGKAAALDQLGDKDQAWSWLMRVCGPQAPAQGVPIAIILNWAQSTSVVGVQLERWGEVNAVLDLLGSLTLSADISEPPDLPAFIEQRWQRLEAIRPLVFEGLMMQERFEQAAGLARSMVARAQQHNNVELRDYWQTLEQAADARPAVFSLESYFAQRESPTESEPLGGFLFGWAAHQQEPTSLEWRSSDQPCAKAQLSSFWGFYEEGAHAADEGNLEQALMLYQEGLNQYQNEPEVNDSDRLVACMLWWGLGVCLDQMGDSEEGWRILSRVASTEVQDLIKPAPLLFTWAQSSIIVASELGFWPETLGLFRFLYAIGADSALVKQHPEVARQAHERFFELLHGAFETLAAQDEPDNLLAFATELQDGVESAGIPLLPLREIAFSTFMQVAEFNDAGRLAEEVVEYAEAGGDEDLAQEWRERIEEAAEGLADPYEMARRGEFDPDLPLTALGRAERTSLMGAAQVGDAAGVQELLQRGAPVDYVDPYGWTALGIAADEGHDQVVRLLAAHGAEVNAVNSQGQTALHAASWQDHLETVEALLELGILADHRDADGNTALHLAATEPVPEVLKVLAPAIGIDSRSHGHSSTALMCAAASGHQENVEVLLALGADPRAQDADGETASDYARSGGFYEVAAYLDELLEG